MLAERTSTRRRIVSTVIRLSPGSQYGRPVLAVACALGAALLYGLASVLHHRVAAAAPAERSLRPSLLVYVLRQPLWLAGIAADIGGFGLQFIALSGARWCSSSRCSSAGSCSPCRSAPSRPVAACRRRTGSEAPP